MPAKKNIGKGIVAGLAGGVIATCAMTLVHGGLKKLSRQNGQQPEQQEDSTVLVAKAVSEKVAQLPLQESEKPAAGKAVHYGYGTLVGGLYGAMAEALPAVKTGFGLPYGTALWVGGDEVALPLLGLSPPPQKRPASNHAMELAIHLVYGAALEGVRRLTRRLWR